MDRSIRLAVLTAANVNLVTAQRKKSSIPANERDIDHELKSGQRRIHCAAADEPDESPDDLQKIEISNFIDTLAEIALAVARRRQELES